MDVSYSGALQILRWLIDWLITQCYRPPDRGDFPAFTPAEAGTRFSDPEEMQGWVDLRKFNVPLDTL